MATKEEAIEEFLKCFRIALNFILLYSKDHKSFRRSVAELKEKAEELFARLDPVEINFTPDALSIDEVVYSKMSLHRELAALFHQRKIQSLKLERGITEEELALLLEKLSLAPKEIIKSGGLAEIFSGSRQNPHFKVIDLDYSQLLRGEGEEVKDIWLFMFHNALEKSDLKKISEFADNFESMIQKLKSRDLVEDDRLKADLRAFLDQLKKNEPEKLIQVSRSILKFIIKDKSVLMNDEKISQLKTFLKDLSGQDYSQILWNEVVSDSDFDVSSFELFSRFLSDDQHKKAADHLAISLSGREGRSAAAQVSRKIRELFSSPEGSPVSEVYRRAILGSSQAHILKQRELVFDRKQIVNNYRYILLNLLLEERNSQRLEIIIEKLSQQWDKIIEEKNAQYLKCLEEVIRRKKDQKPVNLAFLELSRKFYVFIESFIWDEDAPEGFEDFFKNIETSSLGPEVYLANIFEKGKITSRILEAFLKFLPGKLSDFYTRLKDKTSDIDFLSKFVEVLRQTDSPIILSVLEEIYSFSNEIIKIEILRIMARTGQYNREFVFEVLKNSGNFMKKEVLTIFTERADREKALEILFMLPNPWGKNNQILEENLGIVDELKYKPAGQYLEYLYRNTAFWNFRLKKRIKEVLGRLNV